MVFTHPKYGLRPYQRHSLVLLIGGLVYILYGLVITFTWLPDGPRTENISMGLRLASLDTLGVLWIIGGVLVVISGRWPAVNDKWGYTVLTGGSAAWGSVYFAGMFFGDNTLSEAGGGIVWYLVAFLWWSIAGLMNPASVMIVEVEVPPSERS